MGEGDRNDGLTLNQPHLQKQDLSKLVSTKEPLTVPLLHTD
jgi:hypothetical protein